MELEKGGEATLLSTTRRGKKGILFLAENKRGARGVKRGKGGRGKSRILKYRKKREGGRKRETLAISHIRALRKKRENHVVPAPSSKCHLRFHSEICGKKEKGKTRACPPITGRKEGEGEQHSAWIILGPPKKNFVYAFR